MTRNDVIMTSLPKTMENNGEMRTSSKPNKLYIIRKVLIRAIQKCTFLIEFEPLCPKLWAFLSNLAFFKCPLTKYGHVTWLKKQISKNFYSFLILHLISGKVTKFLVEKLSTSEVISQKSHGSGKHTPSQCS